MLWIFKKLIGFSRYWLLYTFDVSSTFSYSATQIVTNDLHIFKTIFSRDSYNNNIGVLLDCIRTSGSQYEEDNENEYGNECRFQSCNYCYSNNCGKLQCKRYV